MATNRVSQTSTGVIGQVLLGVFWRGPLGLVTGDLLGRFQGAVGAGLSVWRTKAWRSASLSLRGLLRTVRRYRRYPLYLSGSSVCNCVSQNLPVLFLSAQYGVGAAGCFALSQRIGQYPLAIIGQGVGQVFLSRVRDDRESDRLASTTFKLFRVLLALGLPFAVLLAFVAPQAFALVMGEGWTIAGRFTQLLTPWLLLVFVASPLSGLVMACGRQGSEFLFQAGLLGARVLALGACCWCSDPVAPVAWFGAASAVFWLGYLFWLLAVSGNSAARVLLEMLRQAAGLAPFVLLLGLAHGFLSSPYATLAAACVLATVLAARLVFVQLPRLMRGTV